MNNTKTTCANLQCSRRRGVNGLCRAHTLRMHRGESIAHQISCAVEGCERVNKMTQGYCGAHAQRVRSHGDPMPLIPIGAGAPMCTVEGCGTRGRALGLCKKHWTRLRRTGSVHLTPRLRTPGSPPHPSQITTVVIDRELHFGRTLEQIADAYTLHPRALRSWLARIGRDDLLRRAA